MILLIDNYDSFTYNLVQYLRELASSEEVRVVRNDAATVDEVLAMDPRAIVLSPGPSVPEVAGICIELIRRAEAIPLLGVCLGHQALGVAYGAHVVRAPAPRHGKTSAICHCGTGLFADLPEPLTVTRYHSLVVQRDSLPAQLEVTSWTADGLVMGLAHRTRPHAGVQFHPEAYLTAHGKQLLLNFLAGAVAGPSASAVGDLGSRAPDPGGGA